MSQVTHPWYMLYLVHTSWYVTRVVPPTYSPRRGFVQVGGNVRIYVLLCLIIYAITDNLTKV